MTHKKAAKTPQTSGLQQDVIIPIKICKKKSGSHTYIMHPKDYYAVTPLSKLLAKAYIMEKRLKQNPDLTFREFCKLNNIPPRYLSGLLQLNNLSPKLKRMIMKGYQPMHLSIHNIIARNVPMLWEEQENGLKISLTLKPLLWHSRNLPKQHFYTR